MPQKSKRKSFSSDISALPTKRGRPRKVVAMEVLIPFGKHEVTTVEKFKSLEKTLKPVVKKPKSLCTNPATSDRHYTTDEVEFMNALAEFKRASGRLFPTCSEILGVLRSLGYEKVDRE